MRSSRTQKKCPACGAPLGRKGVCPTGRCPVYKIMGVGMGSRWRPKRVVMCSTPRDRPLTDAEVEELVYGRQVETVPLGRTAARTRAQ